MTAAKNVPSIQTNPFVPLIRCTNYIFTFLVHKCGLGTIVRNIRISYQFCETDGVGKPQAEGFCKFRDKSIIQKLSTVSELFLYNKPHR